MIAANTEQKMSKKQVTPLFRCSEDRTSIEAYRTMDVEGELQVVATMFEDCLPGVCRDIGGQIQCVQPIEGEPKEESTNRLTNLQLLFIAAGIMLASYYKKKRR